MCVCVSVPGLIAGVVCSSWGVVGVAVSGRVVVSAHRKKQTDIRNETIRRTRESHSGKLNLKGHSCPLMDTSSKSDVAD